MHVIYFGTKVCANKQTQTNANKREQTCEQQWNAMGKTRDRTAARAGQMLDL